MLNKQAAALTVEQVQARFQQWRRQKQGRAAIPDELWAAAIALARRDGVNRTAAALRLDGSKLKGQMTTKVGTAKAISAPPSCWRGHRRAWRPTHPATRSNWMAATAGCASTARTRPNWPR